MNWPFLFEQKTKILLQGFNWDSSQCTKSCTYHQIQAVISTFSVVFQKKQSSEDARILTIFLFINYPQCSRSTNEAPGVYECVRQSGVTKQQARTQPWGSIIENTQPQTHMPAHPPTLTSSLKASSNISADIRVSLSIMNKPSIVLLGPVWHMNT